MPEEERETKVDEEPACTGCGFFDVCSHAGQGRSKDCLVLDEDKC